MVNLDEIIKIGRDVFEATPPNYSDRVIFLNNIGLRLGYRF